MEMWQFIISSVITVIISIVGWVIAFNLINKQNNKSLELEKEKYKYELRQKAALAVLDENIALSDTLPKFKAIVAMKLDFRNIENINFFKKVFEENINKYRVAFHNHHMQAYSRKVILKDINYLFRDLVNLNDRVSEICSEINSVIYNYANLDIKKLQENRESLRETIDEISEINIQINKLLQEKYLMGIFE